MSLNTDIKAVKATACSVSNSVAEAWKFDAKNLIFTAQTLDTKLGQTI